MCHVWIILSRMFKREWRIGVYFRITSQLHATTHAVKPDMDYSGLDMAYEGVCDKCCGLYGLSFHSRHKQGRRKTGIQYKSTWHISRWDMCLLLACYAPQIYHPSGGKWGRAGKWVSGRENDRVVLWAPSAWKPSGRVTSSFSFLFHLPRVQHIASLLHTLFVSNE